MNELFNKLKRVRRCSGLTDPFKNRKRYDKLTWMHYHIMQALNPKSVSSPSRTHNNIYETFASFC